MTPFNPDDVSVAPFDLIAPVNLLKPAYYPGSKGRPTVVQVNDDAKVTRWDYVDGSTLLTLEVKCQEMPHCHSCECGDSHFFYLDDEVRENLKRVL